MRSPRLVRLRAPDAVTVGSGRTKPGLHLRRFRATCEQVLFTCESRSMVDCWSMWRPHLCPGDRDGADVGRRQVPARLLHNWYPQVPADQPRPTLAASPSLSSEPGRRRRWV